MIQYDYTKHQLNVGIQFLVDNDYVIMFVKNIPMKHRNFIDIFKIITKEINTKRR